MAKATAVWLCDNTTLTFKQIANFCGFHELEVQGIADGDVATGVKGFDPIANNQLTQEELDKAAADRVDSLGRSVPDAWGIENLHQIRKKLQKTSPPPEEVIGEENTKLYDKFNI